MTDTDEESSRSPSPPMRKKRKRGPTIKTRENIKSKEKKVTTTDIKPKQSSDAHAARERESGGKPGIQMRNLKSRSTSEDGSESPPKTFAERPNLQGGTKTRVAKLLTDLADRQVASVAKPVEEKKKTTDSKRKKNIKTREQKGKTINNELKQRSDAPAAREGPEPGNPLQELKSRPTSEHGTERDTAGPGGTSDDSFSISMKPSMISGGFWMSVPKEKSALMPSSDGDVSLVRKFVVTYKAPELETPPGKKQARKAGAFSGGWNKFAKENRLTLGDRVTFTKLVDSYEFEVDIERKSESKAGAVRVNNRVRDVPLKKERKEQGSRLSKKISSLK